MEIIIIGAGVMGSALAVPAADNGHRVRLVGSPLDDDIVAALRSDRAAHPRLGAPIPEAVEPLPNGSDLVADAAKADLVVIGISSPGVDWVVGELARLKPRGIVALVTKGLVAQGEERPLTYADALPKMLAERGVEPAAIVGIGGPCIARELAERRPTAVVYASRDEAAADAMRRMLQTPYYRVTLGGDFVGVEACAAMKNFFAIGVSAMLGRHLRDGEPVKNPTAAAFQQAVDELDILARWLGGRPGTAHSLAGLGDLHVTVGGGRNSRLGRHLGGGTTLSDVLEGPMKGETVEGVDVGRALGPAVEAAIASGALDGAALPLTRALAAATRSGGLLHYDVGERAAA